MTAVMLSEEPSVSNSGLTLLKLAVFRKCWNTPAMRMTDGKKEKVPRETHYFSKKGKRSAVFF
jgi:hypothetical protein